MKSYKTLLALIVFIALSTSLPAQWSNRYPKVSGYNHHVYLEAFELPILNAGPTDPAPSASGDRVVFSAQGWLWIFEHDKHTAKRITSSSDRDARPNWSNDGKNVVFVRDTGLDTKIMLLNLESGEEKTLVDTKAMDLDPIFSNDDQFIYYASADSGTFDIWKLELATNKKTVITSDGGSLERLPVPVGDDKLLYLRKKGFSYDSFELMDLGTGVSQKILSDNFVSQAAFSMSRDQHTLVYTWPNEDNYELRLTDLSVPSNSMLLTSSNGLPLTPKFTADNHWIYYSEPDSRAQHEMKRIALEGGKPETVKVQTWDWGVPVRSLKIKTRIDGKPAPVRLHVAGTDGHPYIPSDRAVHSDGQSGKVFFYSDGEIRLTLPHGEYTLSAVQGFSTLHTRKTFTIDSNSGGEVMVDLERVWDPEKYGWYAGDHHFHLNYGGAYRLLPEDIVPEMKGENIHIGFPLVANLHNRMLERGLHGWQNNTSPYIVFGQEVRSHFLGHLNIMNADELFWPWIWGPNYDLYGKDDRTNAEVLRFAKSKGALAGYVHPVGSREITTVQAMRSVPTEMVADYVLGEAEILELACLWTDEIGTSELWHRFLNLGIPISLSAGSDVMKDYFRTMAIGSSRIYAKPEGAFSVKSYLDAVKKGKTFVTTGPLIEFTIDGKSAGEIVPSKNTKVKWDLKVHSAVPYENLELIVNGNIVWKKKGPATPGSSAYSGSIAMPAGGWATIRIHGGETDWPLMESYPFAESGAIWFNAIGSTDRSSKLNAAKELHKMLLVSEEKLIKGYNNADIPKLRAHFDKAKAALLKHIEESEKHRGDK